MAQNIAIERVDHIGVRVRNLDRALAFYRVLGFAVVRRAEGDDVAIIRNEHGVELNLVFNANAGDPATNILMERSGTNTPATPTSRCASRAPGIRCPARGMMPPVRGRQGVHFSSGTRWIAGPGG
jgi:catechol 2,3-dioxygenase-like lactoylglutathione lyase family enzyme